MTTLQRKSESAMTSQWLKIITLTMDHTIIFETITIQDTTFATSTLNTFITGLSSQSDAVPVTTTDATVTAATSITSIPTILISASSLSLNISNSTLSTPASSTSWELPTESGSSSFNPPPASAYTTGLYIALGLFLFFGVLCALVTSPGVAKTCKEFWNKRITRPVSPAEPQVT